MKKSKLYFILGVISLFLFALLIILLNTDQNVIAKSGCLVGLSHINNLVEYNENSVMSTISNVLFYATFLIVFGTVALGIYQLVNRKSIEKVDTDILVFGVGIVVAIVLWILFDKIIKVNVRPIDPTEGSFPSTHVFVTTFFILFGRQLLLKYKNNKVVYITSLIFSLCYILIMAILRVGAGKHYITDVCGGVILGLAFYFITYAVVLKNIEKIKTQIEE